MAQPMHHRGGLAIGRLTNDPSSQARLLAIEELAEVDHPAAETALIAVVEDAVESTVLRKRAARSLGGMARSVHALAALAVRSEDAICARALVLVGRRITPSPNRRPLLDAVEKAMARQDTADLQRSEQKASLARRTMSQLRAMHGGPTGQPDAAVIEEVMRRHPDPSVRRAAVHLLAGLAPMPDAVVAALRDKHHLVQGAAIEAILGGTGAGSSAGSAHERWRLVVESKAARSPFCQRVLGRYAAPLHDHSILAEWVAGADPPLACIGATALARLQHIDGLILAMASPHPRARAAAAEALGQTGAPQGLNALIHTIECHAGLSQASAGRGLIALLLSQPNLLPRALSCAHVAVRRNAAVTATSQDNETTQALLDAVADGGEKPEELLLALAVNAGGATAFDPLFALLRRRGPLPGLLFALGCTADPRAVPLLGDYLAAGPPQGRQAIAGLGRSARPEAVAALTAALPHMLQNERDLALHAIGNLGGAAALQTLLRIAADGRDTPPALQALGMMQHDPDTDLRYKAGVALMQAGGHDAEHRRRLLVVQALRGFNSGPVHLHLLRSALHDPKGDIRLAAVQALANIPQSLLDCVQQGPLDCAAMATAILLRTTTGVALIKGGPIARGAHAT